MFEFKIKWRSQVVLYYQTVNVKEYSCKYSRIKNSGSPTNLNEGHNTFILFTLVAKAKERSKKDHVLLFV